jgi:hypothetical protein
MTYFLLTPKNGVIIWCSWHFFMQHSQILFNLQSRQLYLTVRLLQSHRSITYTVCKKAFFLSEVATVVHNPLLIMFFSVEASTSTSRSPLSTDVVDKLWLLPFNRLRPLILGNWGINRQAHEDNSRVEFFCVTQTKKYCSHAFTFWFTKFATWKRKQTKK